LLLEWNAKINLISRRGTERVWFAHILHSVAPWFFVEIGEGVRVLDLGTGGGLPGIPLAILRPDLRVTLLDSIRKKADAVGHMLSELGLANVEMVTGRAEDIGREPAHRGAYDVVVARAVAGLSDLVKWSKAFLRVGGVEREGGGVGARNSGDRIRIDVPSLLTLKGGDLEAEIRAAEVRGARVRVVPLVFPGGEQIGLEEKKLLIVSIP
jgi:16S rRNA (guanine(527)-N(7))-methyltransferase RsmG